MNSSLQDIRKSWPNEKGKKMLLLVDITKVLRIFAIVLCKDRLKWGCYGNVDPFETIWSLWIGVGWAKIIFMPAFVWHRYWNEKKRKRLRFFLAILQSISRNLCLHLCCFVRLLNKQKPTCKAMHWRLTGAIFLFFPLLFFLQTSAHRHKRISEWTL